MATQTFSFTGSTQTYNIPAGTGVLEIECWGAEGSDGSGTSSQGVGGHGGYIRVLIDTANITNSILDVEVGGSGGTPGGGYNGGGSGGAVNFGPQGGGGGGASDVRDGSTISDRIVAGGGGGGGGAADTTNAGSGDDVVAGDGEGGGPLGGGASGATGENGGTTEFASGNSAAAGGGGGGWVGGDAGGGNNASGGGGALTDAIADASIKAESTGTQTGNGEVVITDYPKPETPQNVTVVNTTAETVSLSWNASADTTGYDIYRHDATGPFQNGTLIDSTATTSYDDLNLLNGELYYYQIVATNDVGGESDSSIEVSTTTVLPAPTNLTQPIVGDTSTDYAWTANHNNGDTRVEYKDAADASWTTFSTVSNITETETVTGLLMGNLYDSRVVAQTEHTETEDV